MTTTFLPDPRVDPFPVEALPATRARGITSVSRWPLALILSVQALISMVVLHNTAFQDEALYLYAGKRIIGHWMGGPAPLDHYATYFSGYPLIYPVIGGYLDRIGGLGLARLFSLACMLGVTAAVYYITARLFQRSAALYASALFAFTGVVLFVGRLATYDALCLLFIALSTSVAVYGGSSKRAAPVLMLGPLLALAVLTKYAGMLFIVSIVGLLFVCSGLSGGWKRAIHRTLAAGVSLGVAAGVAYAVIDHAAFHAIRGSTTNRLVQYPASRVHLLLHGLSLAGPLLAIALFGAIVLLSQRRMRVLALLLFGTSMLTLAYHVFKAEPTSFEKHLAYGLFFAAPLAGVTLDWLAGHAREAESFAWRPQWVASIAIVTVVSALGLQQAHSLYGGWANTSGLGYALHTQLRNGAGRILAEDIEVARFDASDITQEWQWDSFYYAHYFDPVIQHQYLDQDALTKGVLAGYYDLVELSFVYFPHQAFALAGKMAESKNYDLVAVVPFKNTYGKGHYFLFRTALTPGHGDYTDVAQVETPAWYKVCTTAVCQPTATGWPQGYG